jgi:hypothetical protein
MGKDCPRPMTGRERREYNDKVRSLGGSSSRAGKAFINAEHQRFKAGLAAHNGQNGFLHWLWHG